MARQGKGRRGWRAQGDIEGQVREWWVKTANRKGMDNEWAVNIFREHNKETDVWAEKGTKGVRREWEDAEKVVWSD